MPTGIGPQFATDRRVVDHEADRIGDLLRANQTTKLREGQHVLVQDLVTAIVSVMDESDSHCLINLVGLASVARDKSFGNQREAS